MLSPLLGDFALPFGMLILYVNTHDMQSWPSTWVDYSNFINRKGSLWNHLYPGGIGDKQMNFRLAIGDLYTGSSNGWPTSAVVSASGSLGSIRGECHPSHAPHLRRRGTG
jgi:hypothetical protein